MASRFPVTVNISNNRLEELPSGTDLDLTGCGIYDGTSLGSSDQVLTSTGTGLTWKSVSNIGIVESDPIFNASPSSGITNTNITNWDAAYGWGDHSGAGYATQTWVTSQGYLTSYTETDTLDTVLSRGATTTRDITTTGKVYFSNNFATTSALPSATTYHGMFAHVHAEGHGYFAHAGAWTQLLDTGSALSELSNVSTASPSTSDVLTWNGTVWEPAAPTGGGGGATVSTSDTAPASPADGDLWWKSDEGRLKVYYQDVNSDQWVDASPPLATNTVGSGGNSLVATANASTSGNSLEFYTHNGTASAIRWRILGNGSLIPAVNDAYDIGSAEYKVRDMYVSDGSIHTASGNNLSFYDGNLTWGGDDVIMLQDLKEMITEATSFEEFKNAILSL